MFLRRFERRKNGKPHNYWALVESYRTAQGSRQRVVAYLGELGPEEQNGWARFGQHLAGEAAARRPARTLFEPPRPAPPGNDEPVWVKLSSVRLERTRDFGEVWVAWGLWRLLQLDELLGDLSAPGREDVSWATMAAILVMARFCEPSSELHIADTWYRRTALEELLGVTPTQVHTERLYKALDWLLPHKEALERHLRGRLGELFELRCDLLLYDVTSTYFEGEAAANPLARRGYSRDHRPDRPQVCLGLVVTEDGYPLGYEVFAGNTHDSATLPAMVATLERKHGALGRVWVVDRGMVSEANLAFLRQSGRQYIVGTPKAQLRAFEQQLLSQGWVAAQAGVEVKAVPGPDGQETFILARSAARREKEQAMRERFTARFERGLQGLQAAATSGRLRDEAKAHERLGRLKERYWRAAKVFEVKIERSAEEPRPAKLRLTWRHNAKFADWAQQAEGCYLLRSNLPNVDAALLWKRYIQLTDAEWAFRITKDELRLRPVWHQKEERVKAHILVCFLAYALWKALAGWMRNAGLGEAPRTLVEELAKLKSGDVVLKARRTRGGAERQVRLRCVTEPDAAQQVLLRRLGLTPPRRLRLEDEVVQM